MTRTGGVKTLRHRFMHEHDPVFLALLVSHFSRHFRVFFIFFSSVFFSFCECFSPGRVLCWGISRCLACMIRPLFVNVALPISAFSCLDPSLLLAPWASRTIEWQTSSVYVLSEITLGNFKVCGNATFGKPFLQAAILHCAVLLGVGSFCTCTWLVFFYEWPCAC